MKKSCPRCKNVFECEANTQKHCFCADIELSQETTIFLQKTHYDCLCADCLQDLDQKVNKVRKQPFNPKIANLKEGEYFYKEKGMVVLTELYHIAKGSCCMSGCKHCAYGYSILFGF